MNKQALHALLAQVKEGKKDLDQAVEELSHLPVEVLQSARLDHQRLLRTGMPEAVYGATKTPEQMIEILSALLKRPAVVLATRVSPDKAEQICRALPDLHYHPAAGMLTGNDRHIPVLPSAGTVLIVTAGTSDLPVAEEARITLTWFGHPVQTIHDAGVAGLHRILAQSALLQQGRVIIVVAGMEGALPSVVAGLSSAPVIGVPTSIGYGTGSGGYAALLGMLNSCAPGLAVVNIDNGFGAACMAAAINRLP